MAPLWDPVSSPPPYQLTGNPYRDQATRRLWHRQQESMEDRQRAKDTRERRAARRSRSLDTPRGLKEMETGSAECTHE
eukprot:NODE_3088_length_819_cov_43.772727_g2567_i0.p5 GENE.NODE_3088_length_819_cov_43.772727_g2567_i0~~NODE_3088_length_819_cov_43.772727_g2567_i0.p5  ORF type:complete len:78 (+),score=13.50 NODE_3088_length_819_cov_43.772727_g2567_i0:333-566(+)